MNNCWKNIFDFDHHYDLKTLKQILKHLKFKCIFKIIHVVGTNGKGSVAQIINDNLIDQGFKVGLFTSPHLISPLERIKINNQIISDAQFWFFYQQIPKKMNFFASFYLIAMLYFFYNHCEIVILEAGIGGRLDATATIKGSYAILTSLGLDHTEMLGKNLLSIAKEKYGITNDKMRIYAPFDTLIYLSQFKPKNLVYVDNRAATFDLENFKLCEIFLVKEFKFKPVKFTLPSGRCQFFMHNNCLTIFDVAHNQMGMEATLKYLNNQNLYFHNVVIMLKKTKDIINLKALLKNYQVYYYRKDQSFHDFECYKWKQIIDLKIFFQTQRESTLYIGSFQLIGALYGFKTKTPWILK